MREREREEGDGSRRGGDIWREKRKRLMRERR